MVKAKEFKKAKDNTDKLVNIKMTGKIPSIKNLKINNLNNKKVKVVLSVIVLLVLLYLIKGVFIAAIVNNYPISRLSVIRELEKQGGSQVMDSIISERLIMQEAAKKNVKVSKEDVDKELALIEENLKSQGTDLATALSMQGQTKDDLNKAISLKLLIQKTLSDKVSVTEDEIKSYFDTNKLTLYKDKKYEEVKETIQNTLEQQKLSTEYQKWITEIKEKAKIINFVNFGGISAN